MALKMDGTVWAWGVNNWGQLGDNTTTNRAFPGQVVNLIGVSAVSAGKAHNVALKLDGTVRAWGHNGYGQLGDTTTDNKWLPVAVSYFLNC
jgi:alpha-tubulin suppressor-like RCC1 family protein